MQWPTVPPQGYLAYKKQPSPLGGYPCGGTFGGNFGAPSGLGSARSGLGERGLVLRRERVITPPYMDNGSYYPPPYG